MSIKIFTGLLSCLIPWISCAQNDQPKLIIQLVVDQLRGDLIFKHQHQFTTEGFNYLINHGIDFHNAHHPHANTTTCAGHATIATGSYPSIHGVVANDWFDRKSRQFVYCMADDAAPILPTIHSKIKTPGRSPKQLNGSTLSDEIRLAHKGRVFAVSLKDRAAITLAGHSGKAFWFDKVNGGFISSRYYFSNYPQWVEHWNQHYKAKAFDWKLSKSIEYYQNSQNPAFKQDYGSFGAHFPHQVLNPPSEAYFKALSRTPKADQLTADFAGQLLTQESLGRTEDKTDYLAISFSSVDAIGHQFGPNSLEAEDNLLQLDQTLSDFFALVDKQVGLKNTLIILTADHGVDDSIAYLKINHMPEKKSVKSFKLQLSIQDFLKTRFQLPKESLMKVEPPYVYLDHQILREHHLELHQVTEALAQALTGQPSVFKAYPLPINTTKDWLAVKVNRMAYPKRSGDVYLVPNPFEFNMKAKEDRITHGSPWQYDSYVPLIFANPKFKPKRLFKPVYTTDIAVTLSSLLLIKAPSGSVGRPLIEVLDAFLVS